MFELLAAEQEQGISISTVIAVISPFVISVGGIVAALWKQIESNRKRVDLKLDECESTHKETSAALRSSEINLARIEAQVTTLQSVNTTIETGLQAHIPSAVQAAVESVLSVIDKRKESEGD